MKNDYTRDTWCLVKVSVTETGWLCNRVFCSCKQSYVGGGILILRNMYVLDMDMYMQAMGLI